MYIKGPGFFTLFKSLWITELSLKKFMISEESDAYHIKINK